MSNLPIQLFNYDNNEVRSLKKDDGSIWFVNVDVCNILELKNPSQAISKLKDNQKDTLILNDTVGRKNELSIVSETGLYKLVLKSRKKEAEMFQDWICEKVLPEIRQTGSYNQDQQKTMSLEELALLQAQNVVNLRKDLNEVKAVVQDLVDDRQKNLEQLKIIEMPKVLPLQKSERSKLVQLVRTYSRAKNIQISEAWNILYEEYKYTYHNDIRQCARNRNISTLDYVESIARINDLYALAYQLFVVNKKVEAI